MRLAAYIVYFGAGALAADIVAQYLLPPADSEAYWNAKNDYAHVKTISNPKPLSREARARARARPRA